LHNTASLMGARINDPGGVMLFGDGVTSARIRVRVKAPAEPKRTTKARALLGQPGGYNAAQTRRRLSQWLPTKGTINLLVAQGGELLRDRSRDLVRNNPHASSGADSYCSNLVGTGIKPSSLVRDQVLRRTIQNAWAQWVTECDADGICDFYGLQELV